MSLGLMLLNPTSQDIWSSSLGFRVMTEEAFYSSENMNLIQKPLKDMGTLQ